MDSLGYLEWFKVRDSKKLISHLQYVDDTSFIEEECIDNLWCKKEILGWFELNSRIKLTSPRHDIALAF